MKDVLVIDNFYKKPDLIRKIAIKATDWIGVNFDGEKKSSVETAKNFYNDRLVQEIEQAVGFEIDYDSMRMAFGAFAYYPEWSEVEKTTHFDDTDWAGIVYLVKDENVEGGLSFYKHKETNLLGPPDNSDLRKLGFQSYADWYESYIADKNEEKKWEEHLHINMRYNRLVLFNSGKMFHRASSGFGDSPENGRLTQRFFFNIKENV